MDEHTSTPGAAPGASTPGSSTSGATATEAPLPPRHVFPPVAALRRSATDRKLFGVAGGLGRHTGLDPLVFRVLFVVLAVFGGSGILLYALGWLLVPDDGESDSEGRKLLRGRTQSSSVVALGLGIAAVVLGLVLMGSLIDTGPGLGGLGAMVVVAAIVLIIARTHQDSAQADRHVGVATPSTPEQAVTTPAPTTPAPATPMASMTPMTTAPASVAPPEAGAYGQTPGTAYSTYPVPPLPPSPTATPPLPPRPRRQRSPLGRLTLSAALIVVGALVGWNMATDADVSARLVIASALGVVGLGLVVGAMFGRARSLIVWGVLLTVLASAAVIANIPVRGGAGQRTWAPATASELRPVYRLGAGEATLDLTRVAIPAGQRKNVAVRQGIGDLLIVLPPDSVIRVIAHVNAGELQLPERFSVSGTDVHDRGVLPKGSPTSGIVLDINARLGLGSLEVRRATA